MVYRESGMKAGRLVTALREKGIEDQRVLDAIASTPREVFVPETFAHHAWQDTALPIGSGQTISQPLIVARMTAALGLTGREQVLEIGTGSGYQAAILSRLCRRVFTIERHKGLLKEAERRLKTLRIGNVTTRYGDGTKGWPEPAPFDRIVITAATTAVPAAILDTLADGGVLVAPLGDEWHEQVLTAIRRHGASYTYKSLGSVRFVPLVPGLPRLMAPRGQPLPSFDHSDSNTVPLQ